MAHCDAVRGERHPPHLLDEGPGSYAAIVSADDDDEIDDFSNDSAPRDVTVSIPMEFTTAAGDADKPERIVTKLRQVDVAVAQGTPLAEAIRGIGVSEGEP